MKVSLKLSVLAIMLLATSLSAQMTWTQATGSAGWRGRWGHGTVVFNNELWVMGGADSLYGNPYAKTKDDVWRSSDGVDWTLVTDSAGWPPRVSMTPLVFDGKMWVMGGATIDYTGFPLYNDVWSSTDGVHWTQMTDSAGWDRRAFHVAVVFDSMMWVMGGCDLFTGSPQRALNDVWRSSDGANWTRVTDSADWFPRITHTALVFDGKMWVMGGAAASQVPKDDVWYSTNGTDWTLATDSAGWAARNFSSALAFGNKMWIMGGCVEYFSYAFSDVWSSIDGAQWTQATSQAPWPARYGMTVAADFNNNMWVMGGADTTRTTNDVWYSSGLGVQEDKPLTTEHTPLTAAIIRGVLFLDGDCPRTGTVPKTVLIDVSGRKVADLKLGANDVSRLAPGVYFASATGSGNQTRLVLVR